MEENKPKNPASIENLSSYRGQNSSTPQEPNQSIIPPVRQDQGKQPKPRWLMLLMLAGIAIAGYFALAYVLNIYPFLPKTEIVTFTPSPDPYATWQTYRNEEYGFEVKYPPNWANLKTKILEDDYYGGTKVLFELPLKGFIKYRNLCEIAIYPSENWNRFQQDDTTGKPLYITDKDGMIYGWGCGHEDIGYEGFDKYDNATKNQIDLINKGLVQGPFQEFQNLILPTFKVINLHSTSTWKTYTEEAEIYGINYQISYPPDWTLSTDEFSFSIRDKNGSIFTIEVPPLGFGIDNTINKEEILVDGRQATKTKFKGGNNRDRILVQFKEKSLENIQIHFNTQEGSATKIFNQILSTFKFIGQ